LRSADPELVRQEIWAHLAVHHCLTRIIMRLAAEERIDPDRISFIKVLKHVRRSVIRQSTQTSVQIKQLMATMAAKVRRKLDNGIRRLREADRALKRPDRDYRPDADLRRTPSAAGPSRVLGPLQRAATASRPPASPAPARPLRRRPLPEPDEVSAHPRQPHQRVRAGRIEAQVKTVAEFWNPTGISSHPIMTSRSSCRLTRPCSAGGTRRRDQRAPPGRASDSPKPAGQTGNGNFGAVRAEFWNPTRWAYAPATEVTGMRGLAAA
jgi:hypothetical protein